MKQKYLELLKTWTDALLECMLKDPAHPSLDGAIACPACSVIHGRCTDALYPLLCLADISGETKYLDAAKKLFAWGAYMVCDDGSVYNDSQSMWSGVTVFSAIALCKALSYHSRLLNPQQKRDWDARLSGMAVWLKRSITPAGRFNINYVAANAAAMALCGVYFDDASYTSCARELAAKVFSSVSENGLIYGEGSPRNAVTPRGARPIDIGYNAEETLPCLYDYARAAKDGEAMEKITRLARAQLEFMLPDGAWDNSMGTRNFKWTYWGGRTSDGCQAIFNALGKREPMFAEAALRNLELLGRCTDGLLYGGPHYAAHGELACVHHAFCHAKALAQVLDEGAAEFSRAKIPSDEPEEIKHYPELGTWRLARGSWRLTVCAGDFEFMKGGTASGGVAALLWHRAYGPLIAAANTDFSLREAHNMQLTRKKAQQGPLHPRVECEFGGITYSQAYDFGTEISVESEGGRVTLKAAGRLCDIAHAPMPGDARFETAYELSDLEFRISGRLFDCPAARFVLPIVFDSSKRVKTAGNAALIGDAIKVSASRAVVFAGLVFALSPGFEAAELRVPPDENGRFEVSMRVLETSGV